MINCRFINNTAQFIGRLYQASSNSTITNCHFGQNSATGSIGGFYKDTSMVTLTNCVLGKNRKVRTIDIGASEFAGTPYSVSVTAQATPNPVFSGSPLSLQSTPNEPYPYNWTAPSGAVLSNVSQNPTQAIATASGVSSSASRSSMRWGVWLRPALV